MSDHRSRTSRRSALTSVATGVSTETPRTSGWNPEIARSTPSGPPRSAKSSYTRTSCPALDRKVAM